MLLTDVQTIYQRDPAARSWLEVLFCYPRLQALMLHRIAHRLYQLRLPFVPRFVSFLNRFLTGIEIHPGARIGQGVFIDHGMGVVIGETALPSAQRKLPVGDDSVIYQDVTLGGTGKETGKRHPTLVAEVVVGAGAKVLGNIQIGDRVRIGAGSVVLRDVSSNCTVVGVPGRIVKHSAIEALVPDHLRDVEAEVIGVLFDHVKRLEEQIDQLQSRSGQVSNRVNSQPPQSIRPTPAQRSSNQLIEEFLDGAGI